MKNVKLINSVNSTVKKAGFHLRKHSPEILIVAGVIGMVASAVMACRATTKIGDILESHKNDADIIHKAEKEGKIVSPSNPDKSAEYSSEDAQKDISIVYFHTGMKLVKLYATPAILGAASITAILASNNILRKRNAVLGAAYAALDKGFKEYRNRVAERFGEDVEKEIRYHIKAKKFEETIKDEETGKEKKVKTTVPVAEPAAVNDYMFWFDETSSAWDKISDYNLMFLRSQESLANDKLKADGYLFLNDIYEMLGILDEKTRRIKKTKIGQVVGWTYRPDAPNGDNYVDFGICDTNREVAADEVNGYQRAFLLNPNVDGPILDLM